MPPAPPDGADPATRYDAPVDPATDYRTSDPAGTRYTPTDPHATKSAAPALAAGSLPRAFGDYDLLEEIARGGMGVVFKARHRPSDRVVALKMVLHGDLASSAAVARFRAEARAAAGLEHPGIVPIYDVGEADGQHYYTMPFLGGGSLQQALAAGPLPPKVAAAVVRRVAEAVQFAHNKGIIHRDLKPANVLLQADGSPTLERPTATGSGASLGGMTPRLADFGLARATGGEGMTATGEFMGTPGYMAPEQAAADPAAVGPHSDVYGLGAVLYCLLTGRPPFQAATIYETLRQVREEEPASPRGLNPAVPRELETVCLKCLEKDCGRRYGSAAALAEDLRRFREGEPILAVPAGPLTRVVKWARRRPVVAGLLAGLVVAVGAGLGGVLWAYAEAVAERDRTRQQAERADHEADTARNEAEAARVAKDRADKETARADAARDKARTEAEAARKAEAKAAEQTRAARKAEEEAIRLARLSRQREYDANMLLTQSAWEQHHVDRFLDLLESQKSRTDQEDLRNFEWYYWKKQFQRGHVTFQGHTGGVRSVSFSPDGKRLASASDDKTVKVWDAATGQEALTLKGHTEGVSSVSFSPDGKRLASASGDNTVKVWDAATGQEALTLKGHTDRVWSVSFSPDGKRLASASGDNTVKVWDAESGE